MLCNFLIGMLAKKQHHSFLSPPLLLLSLAEAGKSAEEMGGQNKIGEPNKAGEGDGVGLGKRPGREGG